MKSSKPPNCSKTTDMRVLIACEFSGVVRDAFTALGHDATSCDLLPSEAPGKHIQADHDLHLLDIVERRVCSTSKLPIWDLLIFHYPCTHMCNSGVRWLYGGKGKIKERDRWELMERDARYFKALLNCSIPRICGENPIPHKYALEIIGKPYTQLIQPWQFGHGETKATCLWLKNLPPLKSSNVVAGRVGRVHFESPGPDRWKERSRTLTGIAEAMAEQWGSL